MSKNKLLNSSTNSSFSMPREKRQVGAASSCHVGHILLSVLIVWICNRAKGSILVAGSTHAAANTIQAFIPIQGILSLYLTMFVVVLVLILADRMWKKLPSDRSTVYQDPSLVGWHPV
jgi:hypothetical protein